VSGPRPLALFVGLFPLVGPAGSAPDIELTAPPVCEAGPVSRPGMALPVVAAIVAVMALGVVLVVFGFAPSILDPIVQRRAEARAMEASRVAPGYAVSDLPKAQRKLVSAAASLTARQAAQGVWDEDARAAGERLSALKLDRYRGVVVRKGDPDTRMVAITFDDGPSRNTATLVKDLEAAGARATFFFVGSRARGHWQQQQLVLAAGSEIGSHTWSHVRLMAMTETAFGAEAAKAEDVFRHDSSFRPKLIRAMQGDIDAGSVAMADSLGLVVVNWSVHGDDTTRDHSAAQIARAALSARGGDIILLHETNPVTAEALPTIIKGLQKRGLKLVTVSELLAASKTFKTARPKVGHHSERSASGH
jgi:peptidoglycan/xylan/chitin deacetylase (PgdA/CDA1 family)